MSVSFSASSRVRDYYNSLESRIGYRLFLGGTRHFGYYASENAWPWPITPALRRMEDILLGALDITPSTSTSKSNISTPIRVLDAGCGVGHVACYLAQNSGAHITGIDITQHHLVKARRNIDAAVESGLLAEGQVSVRYGDYHDLAMFEDASFDAVYTMETFVHAVEPKRVLSEFYRVLKPGGTLVIHEYDHKPRSQAPDKYIWGIAEGIHAVAPVVTFEMTETDGYMSMFAEAGFEGMKQRDLSKNVVPMMWFFYVITLVPYWFLKTLRLEGWFPNTTTGVNMYLYRDFWRVVQVVGKKPTA